MVSLAHFAIELVWARLHQSILLQLSDRKAAINVYKKYQFQRKDWQVEAQCADSDVMTNITVTNACSVISRVAHRRGALPAADRRRHLLLAVLPDLHTGGPQPQFPRVIEQICKLPCIGLILLWLSGMSCCPRLPSHLGFGALSVNVVYGIDWLAI